MNRKQIQLKQTAADGKIYRLPSLAGALEAQAEKLESLRQGPPPPVQKAIFQTMADFHAWADECSARSENLRRRANDIRSAIAVVMQHLAVKPGAKVFKATLLKRNADRDLSRAVGRAAYEIVFGRGLNAIPLAPDVTRPPRPTPYEMAAK